MGHQNETFCGSCEFCLINLGTKQSLAKLTLSSPSALPKVTQKLSGNNFCPKPQPKVIPELSDNNFFKSEVEIKEMLRKKHKI